MMLGVSLIWRFLKLSFRNKVNYSPFFMLLQVLFASFYFKLCKIGRFFEVKR